VKPGDFPLGSDHSRAAARLMLSRRTEGLARRELIIGIDEGRQPHAGPYGSEPNSTERGRLVAIPYGMSIGDGLRAVGGFTDEELADPRMQTVVDCAEIWSFLH
jgi:hypothetical protein